MIISNQQIAIHLHKLRNLSYMNSGRYQFQLTLTQTTKKQVVQATPVCIIQQLQSKIDNRSQFDDQMFTTKILPLKSSTHIDIKEVYVFKLNSSISTGKDQSILALTIQQIAIQANKPRIVGTYNGIINGQIQHEYLQIDYYDVAPCQIIGTFHRCLYKYDLVSDDGVRVDLKKFCQKYYTGKVDQIVQYLRNQGVRNYQALVEHTSLIFKEQVQMDCVELEEPIQFKVLESQIDVQESQTQIGSAQEEDNTKFMCQKKRQKIFSLTKDYKTEKYLTLEKGLHENAQKMYQLWRQLLQKIPTQASATFMKERTQIYRKKLIEKTKESVSSFKGSWDTQLYGEEQSLRNKMAHQLRNQHKKYSKDLHPQLHSQLPITNQAFFSQTRPIIFQQKSSKVQPIQSQDKEPLLIILVHGLGACRLDMQKLRVQLKRYYEGKARVFISSANEGRTEGQIDNMGMRLASQIDYQITKTSQTPKICLVGHSMGGLIIRSALPRLQKHKKHFHSLITLSSPHLGYTYSSSKLIDVGLWFMNTVKKCTSIKEMNMNDHQNYEKTYLYKLSQKPGLQWFKKIVFLGSHQDLYVPYYSARIQKHKSSILDERGQVKKGKIHCSMANNILSHAKGSIMRLDVNFCIPQQNLDNLIGRAAHISFINSSQMVRTFVLAGKHYFF